MPSLPTDTLRAVASSPLSSFMYDALKLAFQFGIAALLGFVASNFTIGRKLTATEGRIMGKIDENEDVSNARMTKMEHEIWGAQGDNGMRSEVRKTAQHMTEVRLTMERVETKLDLLLGSQTRKGAS